MGKSEPEEIDPAERGRSRGDGTGEGIWDVEPFEEDRVCLDVGSISGESRRFVNSLRSRDSPEEECDAIEPWIEGCRLPVVATTGLPTVCVEEAKILSSREGSHSPKNVGGVTE